MACLIVAESAIFHHLYRGLSLLQRRRVSTGPTPKDVLELPIFSSICLLSSSATVHFAVSALHHGKRSLVSLRLAATVLLGGIFLACDRDRVVSSLSYHKGLTISTNLFGSTYYSLVGLHASHVIVGLIMLTVTLIFSVTGSLTSKHHQPA